MAFGRDRYVEICDVGSGPPPTVLGAIGGRINCIAFHPDGMHLLASCEEGGVFVFTLDGTSPPRQIVVPRPVDVHSITCIGSDKVAAALADGRVLLLAFDSGRLLATFTAEGKDDWLCFTPENYFCGSPGAIERARLVKDNMSFPLSSFAKLLAKEDMVKKSLAGLPVPAPNLPIPPTVSISSPEARETFQDTRQVALDVMAQTLETGGMDRFDLTQDRVPIDHTLLDKAKRDGKELRLHLDLAIPADKDTTTIELSAISKSGIRSRVERRVVHCKSHRVLYVVAIGVADYADKSLQLQSAVADTHGIAARMLAQPSAFDEVKQPMRLIDGEVTHRNIDLALKFLSEARPDDTIVVFAAGHGVRDDAGDYWFLTRDATPASPEGSIKRAEIEQLVTSSRLKAQRRVLFLDTCCAGSDLPVGERGRAPGPYKTGEIDQIAAAAKGIYIMAATTTDQPARETPGHGLFTQALLDGLAGKADGVAGGKKNDEVTIHELMGYVRAEVERASNGQQKPTYPKIEGGGDFVLARVQPEVPAAK